jgi:hypothetical protein
VGPVAHRVAIAQHVEQLVIAGAVADYTAAAPVLAEVDWTQQRRELHDALLRKVPAGQAVPSVN